MEGIDSLSTYELFDLLKREHEKYETGEKARNIRSLLDDEFSHLSPEELRQNLERLFL